MTARRLSASRRRVLKIAGGSITAASVGLAGCMGGDGGDGDGNGGDGGSGDSGGGNTQSQSNKDFKMALAPGGISGIIMDYLEEEGILADHMDSAGYNMEVQRTYDDVTLFASGQIQFAYPGPIGAARMALERDMQIALLNKSVNMFPGWYTRPGTQYDPAEVGSIEQAVKNIGETGTYGTARWSGGTIPADQLIFQQHGYNLQREGGNVDLLVGGFEAMDRAVAEEQCDVATGSPMSGAAPNLVSEEPDITIVLQHIEEMKRYGFGAPALNSWGTSMDIIESDREAAVALLDAWEEGVNWFYDDPQAILLTEDNWENISVDSEEAAQYVYEWGVENQYELKEPVIVTDFRWNDELVSESKSFLSAAQEVGQLPEGWEENLTYVQDI